jgi:hypothetical protein
MFAHQVLVGRLFLVCQAFDFLPPAPTRPSRAPTEPWTNQSTALEVSTGAQGNVGDVDASETILRRDGSAIAALWELTEALQTSPAGGEERAGVRE